MTDWIACTEELPPPYRDVICWVAEGYGNWWPRPWIGYVGDDGVWWVNWGPDKIYRITHWMPYERPDVTLEDLKAADEKLGRKGTGGRW